MSQTLNAALAMIKVLESWGVDHLYGLPGGSINSTMEALYDSRQKMRYIQVRHEEVGALAAAADAKLTGKIGVCFGSAGPGATHLFNGLYDAKMDKVPVLALVGQVASVAMNYDSFQELNENPMFADVSVYNRTVMTPASLPHVVDEAIRMAYARNGVAVVAIPVNFGFADIPDVPESTAANHRAGVVLPASEDVSAALRLIDAAKRPVLFVGQGIRGADGEAIALSEKFSMPIVSTVLAKGVIADAAENYMGTSGRLGTKPGNECLRESDLILFVGSDFPFAQSVFPKEAKFIQVDIDPAVLGRRHRTDAAILGDAGETMRQMLAMGKARRADIFLQACVENRRNWLRWLRGFEDRTDVPLRPEPVFKHINRVATEDAVFVADVGNSTIHAVRLLDMNGKGQRFTTSGLFATMGYGVPGGIAAKLSYPGRQVFTLNGDGAFAMVMQDVITQVRYNLPIINVVFSNDSLGFIDAEQEVTNKERFGVDLTGADYAKIAEGMGARGFGVTRADQLAAAFDAAAASDGPVVIDVKIENLRPFPSESMVLDEGTAGKEAVEKFKARYDVRDMPTLAELMR